MHDLSNHAVFDYTVLYYIFQIPMCSTESPKIIRNLLPNEGEDFKSNKNPISREMLKICEEKTK